MYYILEAFNAGDLQRYQELCHVHNAALNAQPGLVENEKKLLEKINILCLMEIIFRSHFLFFSYLHFCHTFYFTFLHYEHVFPPCKAYILILAAAHQKIGQFH